MKDTKAELLRLLDKPDIRVIALSGKWGTGKSHLWDEIRKEKGLDARYASLFGLSDLQQLKLKLVQQDYRTWAEAGGKVIQAGAKALDAVFKGASAAANGLMELSTMALPKLLRGKLLVIDDLERRNKNLDLDVLLGFIDEFTKQHECRFLLILNEENLNKNASENKEWESYKEKVIDQELRLRTTPKEACEIAFRVRKEACPYRDEIEEAVEVCGITNIRIILKIIQSVDRIIGHVGELSQDVLKRMVPSIVVLAGTYFKGIVDGPDAQYIIQAGSDSAVTIHLKHKNKQIDDEEFNKRQSWNDFLERLGIVVADDFEVQAWNAISTGFLEHQKIDAIVQSYLKDDKKEKIDQAVKEIHNELAWDDQIKDADIEKKLKVIRAGLECVDPYTMTSMVHWIETLQPTLKAMATDLVYEWIANRKMNKLPVDIEVPDMFGRECHPAILDYRDWVNRQKSNKTLREAWLGVAKKEGYGVDDKDVIVGASVEDYIKMIKTLPAIERKAIIRTCMHYFDKSTDLSDGLKKFKESIQRIVEGDCESPRLQMILRYHCATIIQKPDDQESPESIMS